MKTKRKNRNYKYNQFDIIFNLIKQYSRFKDSYNTLDKTNNLSLHEIKTNLLAHDGLKIYFKRFLRVFYEYFSKNLSIGFYDPEKRLQFVLYKSVFQVILNKIKIRRRKYVHINNVRHKRLMQFLDLIIYVDKKGCFKVNSNYTMSLNFDDVYINNLIIITMLCLMNRKKKKLYNVRLKKRKI